MYIIYDITSGKILLVTDSADLRDSSVGDGQAWIESDADVTNSIVVDGAVVEDTVTVNENLSFSIRADRDVLLTRADGDSIKHREQVDLGTTPDLTTEQYKLLLQYKQDLRDIPEQPGFPQSIVWPTWPL